MIVARDFLIYNMALQLPFDWQERFSIFICGSHRAMVSASILASILVALV